VRVLARAAVEAPDRVLVLKTCLSRYVELIGLATGLWQRPLVSLKITFRFSLFQTELESSSSSSKGTHRVPFDPI
jgi:hypothetical protein